MWINLRLMAYTHGSLSASTATKKLVNIRFNEQCHERHICNWTISWGPLEKRPLLTNPSMNLDQIRQRNLGWWSICNTNTAHLCIEVNLCFPSMHVFVSDPSSNWFTAICWFRRVFLYHGRDLRTKNYRRDIEVAEYRVDNSNLLRFRPDDIYRDIKDY